MRAIRYCWVLFLALIPALASAQSIPASTVQQDALTGYRCSGAPIHPDLSTACQYSFDTYTKSAEFTWSFQTFTPNGCQINRNGAYWQGYSCSAAVPYCADGSTPSYGKCNVKVCPAGYTLNGTMCDPVPEACPPDQREWNGQCLPLCDYFQSVNPQTGACECNPAVNVSLSNAQNTDVSGTGSIPDTVCSKGCVFNVGDGIGLGGEFWYARRGTATGATCTVGEEPTETPIPPNNKPPCAANQGVMTSSSGTVACVPEGTPGANKPKVQEKERKETFPDGSEKNTKETTTTDPKTGATNTTTTTTSTGGQAGSAGTTTSEEDKKPVRNGYGGDGDGDCEGDDCGEGEDPEFTPPEGGDLYEKGDRTFKQAWDEFVTRITGAQLPASMTNFFNVGAVPSSCGGMSINVPMLDIMISLDEYICGETGQFLMYVARIVIAAMAVWLAFRIAFQ